MPLAVMVAVNAPEPETGLQSRWYRQHRIPYAPDPPEPDETPVSCRSNEVKAPLMDLAWLSVVAGRGAGACNEALRVFYVGWLRRVWPGATVGGSAAGAADAP